MRAKRLNKIVSALPQCNVLADVGCDHGYVGIQALEHGIARKVIFVDISNDCLKKAEENCLPALKDNASFVCQDGLRHITADAAVIAGMGGLEIISILTNAERLPQKLVLQPMRNVPDVRAYVAEQYAITLDEKFKDGKFYDLIVAEYTGKSTALSETELEFGVTNLTAPTKDFVVFLLAEQNKLNGILAEHDIEEVRARLGSVNKALEITRRKQL